MNQRPYDHRHPHNPCLQRTGWLLVTFNDWPRFECTVKCDEEVLRGPRINGIPVQDWWSPSCDAITEIGSPRSCGAFYLAPEDAIAFQLLGQAEILPSIPCECGFEW
jgi:hypothetical protein